MHFMLLIQMQEIIKIKHFSSPFNLNLILIAVLLQYFDILLWVIWNLNCKCGVMWKHTVKNLFEVATQLTLSSSGNCTHKWKYQLSSGMAQAMYLSLYCSTYSSWLPVSIHITLLLPEYLCVSADFRIVSAQPSA